MHRQGLACGRPDERRYPEKRGRALDPKLLKEIEAAHDSAIAILDNAFKALFAADVEIANDAVDALDAFAADAVVMETPGREYRGLRAIALSLLPYRTPGRVEVLSIRASTHGASAHLRTAAGIGATPQAYRATFRVSGNRIRSLRLIRD